MTREKKFRAWDKKLNVMWEGIELERLLSYLIFQNCPNTDAYLALKDHFKDFEWLQFTGLKDKNGKGLNWWEGDILISPDGQIGRIYFEERFGAFQLRSSGGGSLLMAYAAADEGWEKFGNIYDNPELLEETK